MADPLLLSFDTSTAVGSVALFRGRTLLGKDLLTERREHATRLVPSIQGILADAGLGREELDGIVVGRGPGSFTGVRVAAATARGLAAGLQRPLWAWCSLAAAAASQRVEIPEAIQSRFGSGSVLDLPPEADGWPRYVLLDARGRRVYGACYRLLPDRLETLVSPQAATVDSVVREELPGNVLFCGDGALAHAEFLEEHGHRVLPLPAGLPTAQGLMRIHHLHPGAPPLPPESRWEPAYVRSSSAERPPSRASAGSGASGHSAGSPGFAGDGSGDGGTGPG
jgi:tRNA threonylcarbamoyladenosine biosynthesis protein TsaB